MRMHSHLRVLTTSMRSFLFLNFARRSGVVGLAAPGLSHPRGWVTLACSQHLRDTVRLGRLDDTQGCRGPQTQRVFLLK